MTQSRAKNQPLRRKRRQAGALLSHVRVDVTSRTQGTVQRHHFLRQLVARVQMDHGACQLV